MKLGSALSPGRSDGRAQLGACCLCRSALAGDVRCRKHSSMLDRGAGACHLAAGLAAALGHCLRTSALPLQPAFCHSTPQAHPPAAGASSPKDAGGLRSGPHGALRQCAAAGGLQVGASHWQGQVGRPAGRPARPQAATRPSNHTAHLLPCLPPPLRAAAPAPRLAGSMQAQQQVMGDRARGACAWVGRRRRQAGDALRQRSSLSRRRRLLAVAALVPAQLALAGSRAGA